MFDPLKSQMTQIPGNCPSGPVPPEQLLDLKSVLETERVQIEKARQILRLQMAEVEYELIQLTNQQAELQKIQVAIDQLLVYWKSQDSRWKVQTALETGSIPDPEAAL